MESYERTIITDREQFIEEAHKDPYSMAWKFGVDPREIFEFVIIEQDADMSFGERYFGTNLGSCVDYGRHWDMSDEGLIEKVADDLTFGHQFLGFMDDDKEKVAEKIAIIRKDGGYVKTAYFGD